jgi:TRAP-type C4-dicarboxylate transport system substrate-binding protein
LPHSILLPTSPSRVAGRRSRLLTGQRAPRSVVTGVALVLAIAGCTGVSDKAGGTPEQPPQVLRLVNPRSSIELAPLVQALATVSANRVVIDAKSKFESDSLQGEADAVRAVQSGEADLALIPSRAFDTFGVTSFDALTAPLELDNMALQQAVLSSDVAAEMLTGVEPLGLVGVGILPGPMRVPAGITRPLVAPADFDGARIGVSPSELTQRSVRALGAVPVETTFEGADISALDGIEHQVASIAANQYDSAVRWITANVFLWPRPLVLVANQRRFAALSEDQRRMLRDAARNAVIPTAAVQSDTAEAAAMCRRHRVQIVLATPKELKELRAAFTPVYNRLRKDATTADLLGRIDRLRTGYGPSPGEVLDCTRLVSAPGSPSTDPAPTPPQHNLAVDGNYLLQLTPNDLEASGDDPQIEENWGEFRLSLVAGHFVITQRNEHACTWTYGAYTLTDGQLEMVIDEGGGVAPTHALNKPGEDWTFAISTYRGTMRWAQPLNGESPPLFVYKPWVRMQEEAARTFVDRRCAPPERAFAR